MRRRALAVFDQILAGLSNWITSAVAAAVLGVDGFGVFSRNLLIVLFASGLGGTLSVEPWVAGSSERLNLVTARREVSRAVWNSAIIASLAAAVAAAAIGGIHDLTLAVSLIAGTLIVHLNSSLRLVFLACGEINPVVAADAAWLLITPTLILAPMAGLAPWMAWLIGGFISVSVLWVIGLRLSSQDAAIGPSSATKASIVWMYAVDYGLSQLVATGSVLALGMADGNVALGTFTGTTLLYAPVALAFSSCRTIGIPFVTARVRLGAPRFDRLRSAQRYLVPSLVGATAAYVLLVYLMPDSIGERFLGATWRAVSPLRGVASATYLAAAVATALILALRVAGMVYEIAIARVSGIVAGTVLLVTLGISTGHLLVSWMIYFAVTALVAFAAPVIGRHRLLHHST